MSLINFNNLFADILAKNCGENFSEASQAMIDSPLTSPRVKEIFTHFQATIKSLQPCVIKVDVKCLKNAIVNVGLRGMEEGVKATTGKEQQLFKRLLDKDLSSISEFSRIQPKGGEEAFQIACDTLNIKSRWIRAFLASLA